MVIKYIWNYFNGFKNATLYDIINSKNFRFNNLDLMILDTLKNTTEVYNFKEPYKEYSYKY